MKLCVAFVLLSMSVLSQARSSCDVRVGQSIGVKTIEFATGNVIHSKMAVNGATASAIAEEMVNLQDMGVCEDRIQAKKCVLKYEKQAKASILTLYRGADRWVSWQVGAKKQAQDFVKNLQKTGFCL